MSVSHDDILKAKTLTNEEKDFVINFQPGQDTLRLGTIMQKYKQELDNIKMDLLTEELEGVRSSLAALLGGATSPGQISALANIFMNLPGQGRSGLYNPAFDLVMSSLNKEVAALIQGGVPTEEGPFLLWTEVEPLLDKLQELYKARNLLRKGKEKDEAEEVEVVKKPRNIQEGSWNRIHQSAVGAVTLHWLLTQKTGKEPSWSRGLFPQNRRAGRQGIAARAESALRTPDKSHRFAELLFGTDGAKVLFGDAFVPPMARGMATAEDRVARFKENQSRFGTPLRPQAPMGFGFGGGFQQEAPVVTPVVTPVVQAPIQAPAPAPAPVTPPAVQAPPAFNALKVAAYIGESFGVTPTVHDLLTWKDMADALSWLLTQEVAIDTDGLRNLMKLAS